MGEIYRLTDGTSSMDISPIRGQNEPESRGRQILKGKDGKEDVHEYGGKNVWEVPLNDVSEAKADLLVTWWTEMTTMILTPDLPSASNTQFEVKIAEIKRPMQMWGGDWDTLFAGMLTLYEISSISFSSSSESVSGSTSCSSISPSESCSTGSSLSCSLFLFSVDHDRSCSTESSDSCSTSVSRSCSLSTSLSLSRSCSLVSPSVSVCVNVSFSVTVSSCADLSSVSCSESLGSSCDTIVTSHVSQSCSNDPAGIISCSDSDGDESCSESGAV